MFSVPQSSLSSKSRMIRRERSRRETASFSAPLSMPVAAASCLVVALPMPSMVFSSSRSAGCISSRLMDAYLSPSSLRT